MATVMFATTPKVSAFEVRRDKNLEANEVVEGDLCITGDSVQVKGKVTGNLFVAGNTVEITGDVSKNIFAAGNVVFVSGTVGRSVYLAGNTVDIAGSIERDVFVGASQATINGLVKESVLAGAGMLVIKNEVKENLYAGAGQVTVLSTIGGDAFVGTGTTNLTKDHVKGSLNLQLEDKQKKLDEWKKDRELSKKALAGLTAFGVFFAVMWFVGKYIVSLLVWKFNPAFSEAMSTEIVMNFWRNLGIGALVIFAFPIAVLFLLATLVGIPIALLVITIMGLILFLSSVWTGKVVGEYLLKGLRVTTSIPVQLFVGQLVIALLSLVPFLGFFVMLIVHSVTVGAVFSAKKKVVS